MHFLSLLFSVISGVHNYLELHTNIQRSAGSDGVFVLGHVIWEAEGRLHIPKTSGLLTNRDVRAWPNFSDDISVPGTSARSESHSDNLEEDGPGSLA